jgi:hypothetical protein
MNKRELIEALDAMGIRANTMSFYTRLTDNKDGHEDAPDAEFGTCEISGMRGSVAYCLALNSDGEIIELMVSEELIGGHLGKLAGAF